MKLQKAKESLNTLRGCMIIEAAERYKLNPDDPKIKGLIETIVGAYVLEAVEELHPELLQEDSKK